ncbi:TIGR03986 family type III CRISPR-associated RAMP protein [Phascolarctobacterium succinatutens]|uniref:TIGR03986 family type III CRISPR-associated RAMP protein n=1 Tax=Phascolarctobacterium succinatutens TaxID=626940 RepID=UPI0023F50C38|nr:TIGR03986 family CRISPR-associated RAMP protein [Phascolarctobacterium succinatutens]
MPKTHDYGLSRGSKTHGGGNRNNNNRNYGNNNSSNGKRGYGGSNKNAGNGKTHAAPTGTPTAPYNFVKLNDVVVSAPFSEKLNAGEEQQAYKEFLTGGEAKYSGYFEIQVENITPFFINNGKDKFFTDGANYLIPGSSLRGAIKNYFKILTNGTMRTGDDGDVTDKYLYYRTFASPFKPLSEAYKKEMTAKDPKRNIDVPSSQPGFLVRQGKNYFICPATFKRIKDERKAKRTVSTIEWNNTTVDVFTGTMNSKKHYYQFTGAQWSVRLEIPEKILLSYYADKNGNKTNPEFRLFDEFGNINKNLWKAGDSKAKILEGAARYDFVVPCFYVADDNIVRHFGSGPLYRIPYKKSIGEHIPAKVNSASVDFTAAMFGNKDSWGSRVFFENLYLKDDKKESFENKDRAIPLLGANPTSFQNYLETQNNKAMHWNSDSNIRGYKLYWHKTCDWRKSKTDKNQNNNVTKEIAPLKPGHTFLGRIRFEKLSAVELGALAQVLSLGDDGKSAYKLGMGKSIGLGSVHLKAEMHLQNDAYYTSLFSEAGFDSGMEKADKQQYINLFQTYMQKMLTSASFKLYKERMEELAMIMDEGHLKETEWAKKTAYMNINEPNDKDLANCRIPLPCIKDVVKKP